MALARGDDRPDRKVTSTGSDPLCHVIRFEDLDNPELSCLLRFRIVGWIQRGRNCADLA